MYFNRWSEFSQAISVEPRSGIEPETSSLPWMRSTTELPGPVDKMAYINILYRPLVIFVEPPNGFEPLTCCLQNSRSNQLS